MARPARPLVPGGAGGDAVDPNFGNPGSAGGAGESLNGGNGGSGGSGVGGTGRDGGGGGGGWYGGGGGGGGSGVTEGGGGGGGSSFTSLVNAEVGLDDFANPRVEITPVTMTSTRVRCPSPPRCQASVVNQTAGYPVATGTVSWSVMSGSGTFNRQSCTLNDLGRCSVVFQPEAGAPMTVTIQADYGGDTNHLTSSGTRDIQVNVP